MRAIYKKYMVTIHCVNKIAKVSHDMIDSILIWLQDQGVKPKRIVKSDHGDNRQLHCHMLVEYSGSYRNLTKFCWQSDQADEGISFKIHWLNISRDFSINRCHAYLTDNEYPNWVYKEYDSIQKEAQVRYMYEE